VILGLSLYRENQGKFVSDPVLRRMSRIFFFFGGGGGGGGGGVRSIVGYGGCIFIYFTQKN